MDGLRHRFLSDGLTLHAVHSLFGYWYGNRHNDSMNKKILLDSCVKGVKGVKPLMKAPPLYSAYFYHYYHHLMYYSLVDYPL